MISAAAGGPAAGQPGLHRPGPHSGLGGDLIDRQVAEVVQNQRAALFGGHLAQGVAERDPVGGGPGGGLWPGNQRPEAGAVTGTPPPRGRDAPRRDADPGLGRPVPVDLAPVRPGPHERLLHGVLSLALVPGHRVELPDQPLEASRIELGEFLALHCASAFPREAGRPVIRPVTINTCGSRGRLHATGLARKWISPAVVHVNTRSYRGPREPAGKHASSSHYRTADVSAETSHAIA